MNYLKPYFKKKEEILASDEEFDRLIEIMKLHFKLLEDNDAWFMVDNKEPVPIKVDHSVLTGTKVTC